MSETTAPRGTTAREDFTGTEIAVSGETAIAASAARAKAAVEARYVMAMRRPRDTLQARDRLLKECKRLTFAEAALYYKPIGATKEHYRLLDRAKAGDHEAKARLLLGTDGGARGASIRLVEAAMLALTNIQTTVSTIYEDDERRMIRVEVTDLENNVSVDQEFVIAKTVERTYVDKDTETIRSRTNSRGKKVYLIEASEDEMATKAAALVSKAIRTQGRRLIPADLLDEAVAQAKATLELGAKAEDPVAAQKKIADSFAGLGVTPAMLGQYLGHPLEGCSPGERTDLRALYIAIRDNETTFAEALSDKQTTREAALSEGEAPPPPKTVEGKSAPKTAEEQKAAARAKQADAAKPPEEKK